MATYQDLSRLSTYNTGGRTVRPVGIVFHHTGGRPTNPQTIGVLNDRGYSSNFVMDRYGNIAHGVAPGSYASHMRRGGYRIKDAPAWMRGLGNSNMLGIEISAEDDDDILPEQIAAAVKWAADMGMTYGFDPGRAAYGHGELNGHKRENEGYTIANAVRQHHPQNRQQALMSPAPMGEQYAPDFGMWGAPSVPNDVVARTVRTTREQGHPTSPTMVGAISPARGSFAPADENRWPDEAHAFPEGGNSFSRAEMFDLGRDPRFRQLAIEMLTGRMTPNQRIATAHAHADDQPFAPARMAMDADYQASPSGANYITPYGRR